MRFVAKFLVLSGLNPEIILLPRLLLYRLPCFLDSTCSTKIAPLSHPLLEFSVFSSLLQSCHLLIDPPNLRHICRASYIYRNFVFVDLRLECALFLSSFKPILLWVFVDLLMLFGLNVEILVVITSDRVDPLRVLKQLKVLPRQSLWFQSQLFAVSICHIFLNSIHSGCVTLSVGWMEEDFHNIHSFRVVKHLFSSSKSQLFTLLRKFWLESSVLFLLFVSEATHVFLLLQSVVF